MTTPASGERRVPTTPDPDVPVLDLKLPEAAVCAIHGEPWRGAWPKGMAQLAILAVELIQTDVALAAEAEGDVARIPALLLARPACERVPVGRLRQAYLDAEIGVEGDCAICGRRRLGTPYQRLVARRLRGPRVETIPHICFDCVLERIQPA